MDRRDFMKAGAALGGAAILREGASEQQPRAWRLKYAPRLDWGPGTLVERVERFAARGFKAVEFNGLGRLKDGEIIPLKKRMDALGVEMGIFVANWSAWNKSLCDPRNAHLLLADLKRTLEVQRIMGNRWCTALVGPELKDVPRKKQRQALVEALKAAAGRLENTGLTLVVEPLNPMDHAGYFLARSDEAFEVMKAVGSPHVKILFDIYHQQITEGNLINNIRSCWDEIGYFQVGDVPGRKEPLTGEINYRNVFKAIHARGYQGFLGMEHGLSAGGLQGLEKCFAAYRWCDAW